MGGLGLSKGLDDEFDDTQGHALVGASVAFTPSISADASMWLYDFTGGDDSMVRFTAGVTGRF
jgi:hypothetical protein